MLRVGHCNKLKSLITVWHQPSQNLIG
jgi:hypothetical protein